MKTDQTESSNAAAGSQERRVWQLIEAGRMRQAIYDCGLLNRQFPDYAPGWNTASQLAFKLNNPAMALNTIEKAVSLAPDEIAWLLQKGLCLARLGQMEQLELLVEQLSSRKMKSAYQCSAIGMLLTHLERRDQAVKYYEKAAAFEPDRAVHYHNMACLQRTLGDIESAELNFDEAINRDPSDYESCKFRSELRNQTPENNHVDALEKMLSQDIDEKHGKVNICYALAKELEDLGETERSFEYLKAGADARRHHMQYDLQRDLDTISTIQKTFSRNLFEGSTEGCMNTESIFILGMPRTGTTLVERIMASHTDVFSAGELNNFTALMMTIIKKQSESQGLSRDKLVAMSAKLDFKQLGERYIESTRPFTGHTPRFIDKLPLNYLYVGLIHLALPQAKIIHLRRDPVDTCYAIYKQLFVDAYPFSYDLEELGRYYVAYHHLMDHWHTVLPGVVYTVDYEKIVSDIEGESRKLLEFCELDWQAKCLKFHENKDASMTASTVQVRQPVYQSSVGKWRNYEQQMQPVVDILQQAGINITDARTDKRE